MRVKLTEKQLMPPDGRAILVSTRPNAIYKNGKATGQYDGIRCDVRVLPDLTEMAVKVPGAVAPISNEEIEAAALTGRFTWVTFAGFSGTQWLDRQSGSLRISGTAAGVRLTNPPTDTDVELLVE